MATTVICDTHKDVYMALTGGFGNIIGGMLGGLAGGTAITTQSTNYVQGYQTWQTPINTQTAQWQSGWQTNAIIGGTAATTVNQWQYAQAGWLGPQLMGIGQINGLFTYNQLGANTIQAPTMWVPQISAEQLKQFEAAEEKRRIERETAKATATELLRSQLDKKQLAQFERDGHFDVKIADRVYRITPGRKVHALHEKKDAHLCIMPQYSYELPQEDIALAQKLSLEANEEKFLKTAIRWAA